MTPLKITFQVSGGFVPPPYPLHLDALLAYAQTFDALGDVADEPGIPQLRALADDMPIQRFEKDGDWCYMASAVQPEGPVLNDARFYTQRMNQDDYSARVGREHIQHGRHKPGSPMERYQIQLETARGVHRNLLGFYPVQQSATSSGALLTLVGWCIAEKWWVEDRLLNGRITHIGARRRSGHGKIQSIAIEGDNLAMSQWRLRVRPWKLLDDDLEIRAAWKPPYWAPENRGTAFCSSQLI